jgi:hypothetical protein
MPAAVRLVVLLSAGTALALQAWLGAQEWPILLPLTLGAFGVAAVLARVFPAGGWAPLLITAYIYPAIFHATRGAFVPAYHAIWLAGLFGALLGSAPPLRWHMPAAWRVPLAFWALAVALAWPIIALREMNFDVRAITEYSLANSGLGGPPPVIIVSMLLVVLTQLLGILWFDAMFARFASGAFKREVALPLAIGLAIGSALSVYQWTVDIEFLSDHQWPYYGRAAGGLLDGNAFGALQGAWSGAILSLALTSSPLLFGSGIVMTLMLWFGVWATGSRMALLAAMICLALIGLAGLRGGAAEARRRRLVTLAIAVVLVAASFTALRQFGAHARHGMDPISRVTASLPELNKESLVSFVELELWNRLGPFGSASLRMVRDSPIVGVGTGTFEILHPDYAYVVTDGATRSHFDNAQSWYRHRLAELGILGSLGWITWLVVFGAFVWRAAPSREGLTEATGVKAALIALAVISIVSMPTRNTFVALTFWVFAFWLVNTTAAPSESGRLAGLAQKRGAWIAVWALAIVFAGGTAWVAHNQLRPPHRALMADWNYVNGISRPVATPEGRRLFARKDGVAVFGARPGYLRLVFQLPHEDAEADPVRVRIYERDTLQANLLVSDRDEHTLYVRVPEGADRMMIRTRVSREVPASGDLPARGLILQNWTFVRQAPPGALIGGEISAGRSPRSP